MRLPRRIDDLLKRKEQFLLSSEAALNTKLRQMQNILVSKITEEIIPELDVSGGRIRNTLKNYRLLTSLDKVYTDFQKGQRIPFVEEVGGTTARITAMNQQYFNVMLGVEVPGLFPKVAKEAAAKMYARLGLEGSKIIVGGYFETLIKNEALLLDVKKLAAQAVTGQFRMKDFVRG